MSGIKSPNTFVTSSYNIPKATYSSIIIGRRFLNASLNLSANADVVLQSLSMRFFIASGNHCSILAIRCSFYLQKYSISSPMSLSM